MERDFAVKLTEVDSRSKSNTHQIKEIKKRQDDMDNVIVAVASLANEQGHIKEDVTEIKSDVKTLAEKPAKRWDGLVEKVLWLFVATALAVCFSQIGL